jgi:hypothetical protein
MNKERITIKVLIEKDRVYTAEYNLNQKLQVIVNKTVEHLQLTDASSRVLRQVDGTELNDLHKTIKEATLRDGETLKFFVKIPKPDRDKGFA